MNSYSQVSGSREVSSSWDSSGYELERGPCTVKAGRERGIVDAISSWTFGPNFSIQERGIAMSRDLYVALFRAGEMVREGSCPAHSQGITYQGTLKLDG